MLAQLATPVGHMSWIGLVVAVTMLVKWTIGVQASKQAASDPDQAFFYLFPGNALHLLHRGGVAFQLATRLHPQPSYAVVDCCLILPTVKQSSPGALTCLPLETTTGTKRQPSARIENGLPQPMSLRLCSRRPKTMAYGWATSR
jgi:hypothetical protein